MKHPDFTPTPLTFPALAVAFGSAALDPLHLLGYAVGAVIIGLLLWSIVRQQKAARRQADDSWDTLCRLPIPVVVMNDLPLSHPGSRFVKVNPAAVRRWGYSADTLTTRPWRTFVAQDAMDAALAAAEKADTGNPVSELLCIYQPGPNLPAGSPRLTDRWVNGGHGVWVAMPADDVVLANATAQAVMDRNVALTQTLDAIGTRAIETLSTRTNDTTPSSAPRTAANTVRRAGASRGRLTGPVHR